MAKMPTVKVDIQDPKIRNIFIKRRDAILSEVDAIEEYLGLPKTADMRRFAKETGFYQYYEDENDLTST